MPNSGQLEDSAHHDQDGISIPRQDQAWRETLVGLVAVLLPIIAIIYAIHWFFSS